MALVEVQQGGAVVVDPDAASTTSDDGPSMREKVWRKHQKDLYQTLVTFQTTWGTGGAEFLPISEQKGRGLTELTAATGTTTHGAEQNYVRWVSMTVPSPGSEAVNALRVDGESGEAGGYGQAPIGIDVAVHVRAYHNGDVLALRAMPHNPYVLATASSDGHVYLFDRTTISVTRPPNDVPRPLHTCAMPHDDELNEGEPKKIAEAKKKRELFLETEKKQSAFDAQTGPGQHRLMLGGFEGSSPSRNLAWCSHAPGVVLAGDTLAGRVLLWDVSSLKTKEVATTQGEQGMLPTETVALPNSAPITGIHAVMRQPTAYLGAATGAVFRWDLREKSVTELVGLKHGNVVQGLDTSVLCQESMVTACQDGILRVFDLRSPLHVVSELSAHGAQAGKKDSVSRMRAAFSPHHRANVATAGADGNALVWDITRKSPTAAATIASEDGAATGSTDGQGPGAAHVGGAALFLHQGHQEPINDLGWCPIDSHRGMLLTACDRTLHAWKPRNEYWGA